MKYKLLNFINTNEGHIEPKCLVINNYESYLNNGIYVKDFIIDESYFINNNLLLLIFYGGSVPKREVKNVSINNDTYIIETNLSDITFSSMDLRRHVFLIEVSNQNINKCEYK